MKLVAKEKEVMESDSEEEQQLGELPHDSGGDLLVLLPSDDEDASSTPARSLTIGDVLQALPKVKNDLRK